MSSRGDATWTAETFREALREHVQSIYAWGEETTREGITFFTPFRSWGDFAGNVVAPIAAPLLLAFLAAAAAAIVALAAFMFILSLVVAAASALISKDVFLGALLVAAGSVVAGVMAAFLIPIFALGAVVAPPLSLLSPVTRSVATMGSCYQ